MKSKADQLVAVARTAKIVRDLQKAYFANRTKENLAASKGAERKLDRLLDDLGDPETALGLFA